MKTTILQFAGILMLTGFFFCCSEKDDDSSAPEIISWIKPCQFRNEISGPLGLSIKSDNGFLVAGYIAYNDTNLRHGYVMNLDPNGDTIWCQQIDIEDYYGCDVYYATQVSTNEIMAAGYCYGLEKEPARFIVRLDGDGHVTESAMLPVLSDNTVWECKLLALGNGNFYYVSCLSKIGPDTDMSDHSLQVDLLNSDGQILRSNEYLNVNATLDKVRMLDDRKLLVTGSTYPGIIPDDIEVLFLLIDESGNEVYRREFGTDSWDVGYSVCTDFEDGYLVASSLTYANESAIYALDAAGEVNEPVMVADTIYSHRTYLDKASNGEYLMFVLSTHSLYLSKLRDDFQTRWTYAINHPDFYTSLTISDIVRMGDGSFAFICVDNSGYNIMKTIPL